MGEEKHGLGTRSHLGTRCLASANRIHAVLNSSLCGSKRWTPLLLNGPKSTSGCAGTGLKFKEKRVNGKPPVHHRQPGQHQHPIHVHLFLKHTTYSPSKGIHMYHTDHNDSFKHHLRQRPRCFIEPYMSSFWRVNFGQAHKHFHFRLVQLKNKGVTINYVRHLSNKSVSISHTQARPGGHRSQRDQADNQQAHFRLVSGGVCFFFPRFRFPPEIGNTSTRAPTHPHTTHPHIQLSH